MAITIFPDTHKTIAKLQRHGFSEEQATGLIEATQELDLSHLATKADLKDFELRMTNTLTNRMIAVVSIGVAVLALIRFL